MEVDREVLDRVCEVVVQATKFHMFRDSMNGVLHMQATRYSPLTNELTAAQELLLAVLVK